MRGSEGALGRREEPVNGSQVCGKTAYPRGWSPRCGAAAWELPIPGDQQEPAMQGHLGDLGLDPKRNERPLMGSTP